MLRKLWFLALALALAPVSAVHAQAGAVYAMTNALDGNEIAVYDRAADGTLTLQGYVPTGGLGVGNTTEPVDALGSQGPLVLSADLRWLFAVNAGSDEISVFRVQAGGLTLVDKVPSGGLFPASLTVHRQLLYVLNSGGDGNLTGFTIDHDGRLSPLPGSTRSLGAGGTNPPFFLVSPAQVAFDPKGDVLVATVKGSNRILVYSVGADGLPSAAPVTTLSHGNAPFGFAFDERGRLLVAEPFGNAAVGTPNASAVSSYEIEDDGSLRLLSASVENGQTATCWLGINRSRRFAYTTNNASGTISGYRIGADGGLTLLDAGVSALSGEAPVDLAFSPDGRFLYNVNAGSGTVSAHRVNPDGSLTELGEVGGLPADDGAVGIAAR